MFGKIFIAILISLDYSNCWNLCGDWTQYKDIKCIKVLERKGTEEEALNACTKLDQSSILLTIHSKDEQDYLNSLLEKYHNISLNVWLGMKYSEKAFKWMDGTNTDYTNWSENAVKDGSTQCAEMSFQKESIGKWSDVSCLRTALIVCQKKQEFNLNTLKNALDEQQNQINYMTKFNENKFENLTKVIENQEIEINTQKIDFTQQLSKQQNQINIQENQINSLIPIGFLYTQLPNQSSPLDLWPNLKWSEITSQYSGLFFRAEGRESLPFGQTQMANQSTISDVFFWGCRFGSWSNGSRCDGQYTSLNREQWTNIACSDGKERTWWELDPRIDGPISRAIYDLKFYKTSGEVRPKNTAIKIFKRIQ